MRTLLHHYFGSIRFVATLVVALHIASARSEPAAAPTDAKLLRAGAFDEPLVPVGRTSTDDNRDLAHAVDAYTQGVGKTGARDAVKPLVEFLDDHPGSAWVPTLLLHLGAIYRETGHFSKALDAFSRAWHATEHLDDPNGRALGDAAVANLSQFEAYLGRKELLAPLLAAVAHRPLRGTSAELVSDSSRGLANMRTRPEASFKCGPLALFRIHVYEHPDSKLDPNVVRGIAAARSTANGLSLPQVRDLSRAIGMNYQMAFRTPGAPVILPAVAHWKVGHYAAIVDRAESRYVVEDSTFGPNIRIDPATLDEEASGYFLVPAGKLPAGWRAVSVAEGSKVWGRGDTGGNHDPGATNPSDGTGGPSGGGAGGPDGGSPGGSPPCSTGCTVWNVQPMVVGVSLRDTPVGYTPPVGPEVKFGVVYAQRDAQQPAVFDYTNLGNKWTTTWLSYVTDNYNVNNTASLYRRGGGSEPYTFGSASNTSYLAPYTHAILTRQATGTATTGFTRQLGDGSIEHFDLALGTKFLMTSVSDPQGNAVTLGYDAQFRIVTITDAIGQITTLSYDLATDPLKVTKVTDPFGRSATFTYDASGHLASSTDVLGITSSYTYGSGDFITTLTTPYGATTFTYGDSTTDSTLGSTRFVTVTDPLGRTSRVEFRIGAPGIGQYEPDVPAGLNLTSGYGQYRNTFVWGPTQLAAATSATGLDYTKARILHWPHAADRSEGTARVFENTKEPLEHRIWYSYVNQFLSNTLGDSALPVAISRTLDDGTSQIQRFRWDTAKGSLIGMTDPSGRDYTFTYAPNGIDLLTVTNTTAGGHELLSARTYDAHHDVVTLADASGQISTYAYNARGQRTRFTDAFGNTTTYSYDTNGYLTGIMRPMGATYALTYDGFGRVASVTDPAQATTKLSYDAMDRVVQTTYPDGATKTIAYTLLEVATITDRLGQTTTFGYDADRELTTLVDPLGNTTRLDYCDCGKVSTVTDPKGGATVFTRDLQDRVTARQNIDGSRQTLAYEVSNSRVHSIIDALGQSTRYTYNRDDTVGAIAYDNALVPTPGVGFSYDASYRRLVQMIDGSGTTSYAYGAIGANGATRPARITSPIAGAPVAANDVVGYSYDELGRAISQTIDDVATTRTFDALGRIRQITNPLDTFTYRYTDPTRRIAAIETTRGVQTALTYDADSVTAIVTTGPGDALLSQLGYSYDAERRVATFTEKVTDGSDRATKRVAAAGLASLALLVFALFAVVRSQTSRVPRRRRRLALALAAYMAACSGNPTPPADTMPPLGPHSLVTSYARDTAGRLTAATTTAVPDDPAVPAQARDAFAYAYDANSNLTSITANGTVTSVAFDDRQQLLQATYDANGNPTAIGDARYTWDAAGRLVTIVRGDAQSDFSYDGFSRLVRIVDQHAGSVVADHAYLWCGDERCVERDNLQAGSPITKRYFEQGVAIGDQTYLYVKDLLGSVHQLVDTSGAVRAQYSYDPYGKQTKISGDIDSDVTYAGLFHHAATGLHLARLRAYDPQLARWLDRDPIGFAGGQVNLFSYVYGDPASFVDPRGTFGMLVTGAIGAVVGAAVSAGFAYATGGDVGLAVVSGAIIGGTAGLTLGLSGPIATAARITGDFIAENARELVNQAFDLSKIPNELEEAHDIADKAKQRHDPGGGSESGGGGSETPDGAPHCTGPGLTGPNNSAGGPEPGTGPA